MSEANAWHRGIGGWHLVFTALAALTAVLIVFDPDAGSLRKAIALGVLAAIAAAYLALGSRALGRDDAARGLAYIALALPLTVGLFALTSIGSILFFLLYPHIWALLPTRRALIASALAASGTAATLIRQSGADLWAATGIGLASLFSAWLLGTWINRIVRQSEERARLIAELDTARTRLAEAARETGVLAERQRLARDIHDTVAQGLAAIIMLLDVAADDVRERPDAAVERIRRAHRTAAENLAEARALVAALRPPDLRDSLGEALRLVLARHEHASLAVTGEARPLETHAEVAILRTTQEALANAARHAGATRTRVELEYGEAVVRLVVRDDGCGFTRDAPQGNGLWGMRERFAELAGSLSVESAPGHGTVVRGELPL
ncbi:two-component sensor histidine kinase [Actinorhabdospora filicis]|uniref:Two-component sensor histidine kinase n=1 Tax=Actinorhabdospora filicis TaxID=1785913 RepID=A0A9W6WC47_9ACTN|nr:sensor histidine kinase [Actinorhabdospora filicis]GLZ81274.1 two-component sensor histidine kinase [Actinorhabdospora filicis]